MASLDLIAAIIFVIGIIVLRKWKPNPLWVMAGSDAEERVYSMVEDDTEFDAVSAVFENILEDIDLI